MTAVHNISRAFAASGLARLAPSPAPLLLMYHGVGGADGIAPQQLREQWSWLRERHAVRPLPRLVEGLGTAAVEGTVAITFDDGYVDFAELALPLLDELDLHATLYVPSGQLGGYNAWDAGTHARREILGPAALRELGPRVEVGAHGHSHRRMVGLDPASLRQETAGAKAALEDALGRGVLHFAYPYGQLDDFDAAAERAVEAAGFLSSASTHFGRRSSPAERYRLRRVGVWPEDDLRSFVDKVQGAWDWCALKERAGVWRRRLPVG